jgi:hypothetical protein
VSTPLQPKFQARLQQRNPLKPIVSVTATLGTETQALNVTGGSVTIDRRRRQRTTATLNVEVTGNVPGILTPFGTDVSVSAGLRLIDGSEDLVPLGTSMMVTSVEGTVRHGATLSVQLAERSQRVKRWRFETPFTVPGSTDLAQVIAAVLNNRGYACVLNDTGRVLTTSRVFGLDAATDPWDEAAKLAEAFGYRLWVGRNGQPVLDQPPAVDANGRHVFVLEPTISLSGGHYNVVVGRWEPTDGSAPRYAMAEDLDPASPTFVGGPYGRVTYFFASPLPISQAGANQAVQTILAGERYQGNSWRWGLPFDPTIDPDDVLHGIIPIDEHTDHDHILQLVTDAVTINLSGGTVIDGREVPLS